MSYKKYVTNTLSSDFFFFFFFAEVLISSSTSDVGTTVNEKIHVYSY